MDIWNGYELFAPHDVIRITEAFTKVVEAGSTRRIAVGGDGGGNLFVMETGVRGGIWKWHHDSGQSEIIAPSFADFLERLECDL